MNSESAKGEYDHGNSNFIGHSEENNNYIQVFTKPEYSREKSDEKIFYFIDLVEKCSRLIQGRLYYKEDNEDVRQEAMLKILKRFKNNPLWFKNIDNVEGYVWKIVLHKTVDLNKKRILQQKYDSIDDENNSALFNKLTDKGDSQTKMNNKLDSEFFTKELSRLAQNFSDYEWKLVKYIYFEGYKPKDIAETFGEEFPNKSRADFSRDCNAVKSKFKFRLRKYLEGLNLK